MLLKVTLVITALFTTYFSVASDSSFPLTNKIITGSADSSSKLLQEECVKTLKEMQASLSGSTSQGNSYSLYAIKRGKEWTYLILDNSGYYSIKQIKGKEEMEENPSTYTDMLCLMAKANMIRKTNKAKNVSGMTFACYYRFRPKARQMYRSFSIIQRKGNFLKKSIKEGPGGIAKILKKSVK